MTPNGQAHMTRALSQSRGAELHAINIDRKDKDDPLVIRSYQGPGPNSEPSLINPTSIKSASEKAKFVDNTDESDGKSSGSDVDIPGRRKSPVNPRTPSNKRSRSQVQEDESDLSFRSIKRHHEATEGMGIQGTIDELEDRYETICTEYGKKKIELRSVREMRKRVHTAIEKFKRNESSLARWYERVDENFEEFNDIL